MRQLAEFVRFACVLALAAAASPSQAVDFVTFETGPVRPLARDGAALYALNTPDNQLHIFDITDAGLIESAQVQVGMEPCAVAVAPNGLVWVVNHLSDSVSIVDPALSPPRVVQTLLVGDEPRDIVFAGNTNPRAFITTARRGQHRTHASISGVTGAGDPLFTTEGTPRADVWVFDAASPGTAIGGTPDRILSFFADTPRALAASNDGQTLYVGAFHSGNQTTTIPEQLVCDGFDPNSTCLDPIFGILTLPAGLPGPNDNVFGASAPETGLIVKFDNGVSQWKDGTGNDWSAFVNFTLPDRDVFAIDADTLSMGGSTSWDHVGTILFNMAVHPTNDKLYVSNTESPNQTRFEGPGVHGGSTVQGHLSESRISVLSGTSTVDVRHLNKHLDYSKLHTANDPPTDAILAAAKPHSLATPMQMIFDGNGDTVYVAAFGSAKVGVLPTATLENDSFDPTSESANYIPTGGGPSGLVLDEPRDRLYVLTRFDNSLAAIDLATSTTFQTVPLHNPEPSSVVDGRPFLYDAQATSGNGEASCASCHIFGDFDGLAWDLGDPDAPVTTNNQPSPTGSGTSTFHPMKGPMTTQTLRGLATHGAMHWRGDRLHGFFAPSPDPCTEPSGAACIEELSFKNFIVAFEGLVGKDDILDQTDMQSFSDFALQIVPPPNPVRALDNSLNTAQTNGAAHYQLPNIDATSSCNDCHTLDPLNGFFGTGGGQTFEGLVQNFKVSHLRNMYAKVGMFGMFVEPDGNLPGAQGEQVRGVGFLHNGIVDTTESFVSANPTFNLSDTQQQELEQFMLAFDTDLAPMVGQQVTLDATNSGVVAPRIAEMETAAAASFDSLVLGGSVVECDLVVKGKVGSAPRGWVYRPNALPTPEYDDDIGGSIASAALQALAISEGPLTYTCVPPGAGDRMGINRDRDALSDGLDNCADAANDLQTDTDGDLRGDACDQDDDDDTLLDVYETGTGTFVSAMDTGSNPLLLDTDGDGIDDGAEVLAGSDPNDANSPASVPGLPLGAVAGIAGLLVATGLRHLARRGRSAEAG